MIITNRYLIALLLSLLLVGSGSVAAITKVADGHGTIMQMNCASMLVDQTENDRLSSENDAHCVTASDMACQAAGGLGQCGFGFVFVLTGSADLPNTGSFPVLIARVANYQAPFLASITPPPQSHS